MDDRLSSAFGITPEYAARLTARFERWYSVHPNGCWIWTGTKTKGGYGRFVVSLRGKGVKTVGAHRLSWLIHRGELEKQVCHRCDVPSCVNPAHLWLGDARENLIDCLTKGRHSRVKLTTEQVLEIRRTDTKGKGARVRLAARLGIHPTHITHIKRGENWRHI